MSRKQIDTARIVARLAHRGQKYGTADYFDYHIEGVVSSLWDDTRSRYMDLEVAYLHDILEDTEVTEQDLLDLGFSTAVVDAVRLLTRREYSYQNYISKIVEFLGDSNVHFSAVLVKFHDAKFNYENSSRDYETLKAGLGDTATRQMVDRARSRTRRYKSTAQKLANKLKEWSHQTGMVQDILESEKYLKEVS